MKDTLANIVAVIWFLGALIWAIFYSVVGVLGVFFFDILEMIKSGFPTSTVGFQIFLMTGIVFAITGIVPVFRRCYYKMPWLYPFCMMTMMNLFIVSIIEVVIAKGFSVINTPRHIITEIIAGIIFILCRLIMSIYIKKKPMVIHKYDVEEASNS